MSPHLLHRMARESQLAWRRELARQRLLASFFLVAISFGAIVGLYITNPYW